MSLSPRQVDRAIDHALRRLRQELPQQYSYHNLWHTEQDVLPAVVRLAQASGLTADDTDRLRLAAAYHDIGFLERVPGHEKASVRIAVQALPRFDISPDVIDDVIGMIMATRLPQSPLGLLEQIMVDADLDVLGRPDYGSRSLALRQERASLGDAVSGAAWFSAQLAFVRQHRYFTPAARASRDQGKEANINWLERELGHAL